MIAMPDVIPVQFNHNLNNEIEKIVQEHLKYDFVDDYLSTWEFLAENDDMKIYRQGIDHNGIHKEDNTVDGVTGHEMCKHFFDPKCRMEWDMNIEKINIIERISSQTIIFHQIIKRVWPACQRGIFC